MHFPAAAFSFRAPCPQGTTKMEDGLSKPATMFTVFLSPKADVQDRNTFRVSLHIGTQIVDCVESAALSAEKVQISLPEGVLALGAPRAGRKAEPWWIEWSTSIATHRSISAGGLFEVHLAMPH
jgi:hypothetical protein